MTVLMELKNINKTFGKSENATPALKNINITINSGELIILTGPSGSGKTTLLTIMGALQKPSSGTVLFDDKNIDQLKERQLSKLRFNQFGFILQSSNLIPFLSVKEQLSFVDRISHRKASDRPASILKDFDVLSVANQLPDTLSGGQRQRVAIARGIYNNPKILFADEPTASLDSKRASTVIQKVSDLAKQSTSAVVMITHDENLYQYADRVITLVDGEIKN